MDVMNARPVPSYGQTTNKGNPAMQGVLVFKDLEEAERRGFQFFDRRIDGVLVRKMTSNGWALALVSNN